MIISYPYSRNVREQMARSLVKLKEYEKQVKQNLFFEVSVKKNCKFLNQSNTIYPNHDNYLHLLDPNVFEIKSESQYTFMEA